LVVSIGAKLIKAGFGSFGTVAEHWWGRRAL
jgi:hypothetical protein